MLKINLDNCKKEEQIEDNLYFKGTNLSLTISEGLCGKTIALLENNVILYHIPYDQLDKAMKEANKYYGETK